MNLKSSEKRKIEHSFIVLQSRGSRRIRTRMKSMTKIMSLNCFPQRVEKNCRKAFDFDFFQRIILQSSTSLLCLCISFRRHLLFSYPNRWRQKWFNFIFEFDHIGCLNLMFIKVNDYVLFTEYMNREYYPNPCFMCSKIKCEASSTVLVFGQKITSADCRVIPSSSLR